MKTKGESIKVVIGAVLSMIISLSLFAGGRAVFAAPAIPAADVTYTQSNAWPGTLTISENKTIKLSGVTLNDVDGPVISIQSGKTLNLVIEGVNTLSVLSTSWNACIEVPENSVLNVYGVEGGTLNVTGGFISAGIGTKGVANHTLGHSPYTPGTINIYSGSINATGGTCDSSTTGGGPGIGAGSRNDGGVINIYGGYVTAYGQGGAAGIGSGYCTSGGDGNNKSGSFTGGTITIAGGTVRAAAAKDVNFTSINANDPSSYSQYNSFGAGIGGGYGSRSGTIIINGNADVIAVGFGGGAGIGAGRGTSKENKYDKECTPYDITISGDANVKAYAGIDNRHSINSPEAISGAAIGGGRGFGMVGQSKGSITIKDNALISANAGAYAQAIGSSVAVKVSVNSSHVFSDSDFSTPATAEIEAQCLEKMSASVGGQEVENVSSYFKEVLPTPTSAFMPPATSNTLDERLRTLAAATPVSATVTAPASWTKDSGDYTFRIETDNTIKYADFSGLFVDNNRELVENTDFTKNEGSVILVVKSSALKSLSSGNHTFSALFGTDKKVNLSFTLKNATSNYDDDDDDDVSVSVTNADGIKKAPRTGE